MATGLSSIIPCWDPSSTGYRGPTFWIQSWRQYNFMEKALPLPPPKKKNKTEGKCGLWKHPRLRSFRTEQSWFFVFMILNICFFTLLDFSSLNILGFVLWKGKITFFQILFLLVVTLLRTEPSTRCSFWQKLDCVFSQLHSWIWRFRVLYWIRYTCEWNTNTIHLSPQRTKIWTKYSKDIETYVDKRAHLGKTTFNWFLNISKILSQPLSRRAISRHK